MKIVYTIEIAARGGEVSDDVKKTVDEIKKFKPISMKVGDESKYQVKTEENEYEVHSGFVEAVIDGDWNTHVEFTKRFAPTVIEPLEGGLEISGADFFKPIMVMAHQSRRMLSGTQMKVPIKNFTGVKKLTREEIEKLIIEERQYRVNLVFNVSPAHHPVLLGLLSNTFTLLDYKVKGSVLGVDVIGKLEDIVMMILLFFASAVAPVEPIEYDLKPLDVVTILMIIADRSREVVAELIRKNTNRK